MSSLSGGARRATGARPKKAGQLEQHLLIQTNTNGLALATGRKRTALREPAGEGAVEHRSGRRGPESKGTERETHPGPEIGNPTE